MRKKTSYDWDTLMDLPVLPRLRKLRIEMDQRLSQAWARASKYPDSDHASGPYISDDMLIAELLRLNPRFTRISDFSSFLEKYPSNPDYPGWLKPISPNEVYDAGIMLDFFGNNAPELATGHTLTSGSFIKWIIDRCTLTGGTRDTVVIRPNLANQIAEFLHGDWWARIDTPQGERFLSELAKLITEPDDFQYIMTLQEGKAVFRIVSLLDDYHQRSGDGDQVPFRALITHFGRIGLFTEQSIQELEELVNSDAREDAFQRFFEAHPHFLRHWDYREVYPQVYLTPEEHAPLIPDFILTNNDIQNTTIIDLKRPIPKIIRHQRNRDRFANAVMEARSQLLEYRRFFEDTANRQRMRDKLKMDIYNPHLAVIIGRSSEFSTPLQRQKLTTDIPEIEIVTYDDILQYAKFRRTSIEI